jgi:hypothetical protein
VSVVTLTVSQPENVTSVTSNSSQPSQPPVPVTEDASNVTSAATTATNPNSTTSPNNITNQSTTTTTTTPTTTTTTITSTSSHVNATAEAIRTEEKADLGSYGYTSEVVLICLVVIFGLMFITMVAKYYQLKKNIGDYRIQQVRQAGKGGEHNFVSGKPADLRQPCIQRVRDARQLPVLKMTRVVHRSEADLPLSS